MPSRPPMGGQQPQPGGGTGGSPVDTALAYGRRKMGLPSDFENGHSTPSFDDGGVVPDPSAVPQQPEATDPQSLLKYLSGDGALSPDVMMAMEAMADPDNSMDATDRLQAVLGRAPSPDVAFGVLQHHRTKYNGHTAAARVAADKGDYAKAAMHANKAHESVPGSRRRFAPTVGGVHMIDGQGPQEPQEQAYGQGGTVDASNPNEETDDENSYADGGEVDTRYDDFPESENVEDRRREPSTNNHSYEYGSYEPDGKPEVLRTTPRTADPNQTVGSVFDDQQSRLYARQRKKYAERGTKVSTSPPKNDQLEEDTGRAAAGRQSFAYGGEVEEDNTYGDFPDQSADEGGVTAAVTPEENDDDLTTGSTYQQAGAPRPQMSRGDTQQDDGEPRMLSPEDLSRQMSLGWDAAVAGAKPKEDALSGRSYGQRIWDLMPSNGRTYKAPQGPPTGRGDTEQGEDSGEFPWQGPMPADGGAEPTGRGDTQAAGEGVDPDAGYKKDRQHANERRDEMMQWYEDQSRKLFPWASQEPQRQAFIMHGMERFFGQDLSRENNIRADKAGIAERGIQAKAIDNAETRRVREESNIRNNDTRKQVAAFNQTQQGQRFQQGQLASTLRAQINAGADITDPKVTAGVRQAFEQTTGHKIDQNDHDTIKEILGLNRSIVKSQGQGQGDAPPVGSMQIDRATGRTRTMQVDGTWKIN